ncbi:MAG: iron donor protein CyaY [Buchnera aphidicola (Periphyllus aceris)]|nr:iron donor protein CyaY [Buchnera aphidicola (Periphyllus aceris)]
MNKKIKKKNNILNYHNEFNKIIIKLENSIDNYMGKIDIDYESNQQIMKISINSINEIIINKQEFLKQIWVATKYKGYYFNYYKNKWFCKRNNCEIFNFFKNFFIKKIGKNILFNL